jgi:glycerate kinase
VAKIKIIFVWKFDQLSTNMKKVVVASDSFKGCLSSSQVAKAVEAGVHDVFPDAEVVILPVADGGEGSLAAIRRVYPDSKEVTVNVYGPLYWKVDAKYLILPDGKTAFIEIAQACGLELLEKDKRDPLKTSTYGFGQMIADAISRGCTKVIAALGGTSTNDAGAGMLSALGFRITNADGTRNACYGAELVLLDDIDDSDVSDEVKTTEFVSICDVTSPMCGPDGAAYVYAPQKGACICAVRALDDGLSNFADVAFRKTGVDIAFMPGAGAAGGVAGAMHAFLGAKMVSGSDVILDAVGFEDVIQDADLVITGEGRADHQTLTGKLPYKVAQRAAEKGIPVIAICGTTEIDKLPGAEAIIPVTPDGMPMTEAKKPTIAKENIRAAVGLVLKSQPLP